MPPSRTHTIVNADHATWEQLKSAATKRLQGAKRLLETSPVPQLVVYLLHVALECALKARIVRRAGCRSVHDLREKKLMPEHDFARIFRGTDGHRLGELSKIAQLAQLLAANDVEVENAVWQRMCHDLRPYSARYGSENPSVAIAKAEFTVGETLVTLLEENTK